MEPPFTDRMREKPRTPPIAVLIGLKINFLRPVFDEKLTAKAKVLHRGNTVGLVECDVVNEAGKPVARASSTCSVLRGEAAKGR